MPEASAIPSLPDAGLRATDSWGYRSRLKSRRMLLAVLPAGLENGHNDVSFPKS